MTLTSARLAPDKIADIEKGMFSTKPARTIATTTPPLKIADTVITKRPAVATLKSPLVNDPVQRVESTPSTREKEINNDLVKEREEPEKSKTWIYVVVILIIIILIVAYIMWRRRKKKQNGG